MGDMGDYWRDHRDHQKALRRFWHECPNCAVRFGTGTMVAPGQKCRHDNWVSPGNVGDDVKANKELQKQESRELSVKIVARKKKAAEKKDKNTLRRCPYCSVLLKNPVRKGKHVITVHGQYGSLPIDGIKNSRAITPNKKGC